MSKYDKLKEKHADCKKKMSSREWKKFAIEGKGVCPVCGER